MFNYAFIPKENISIEDICTKYAIYGKYNGINREGKPKIAH